MKHILKNSGKETVDKYKFSIITAVYNTEKYLDEMVQSLLVQDIGFCENVQLILIDDGSEDNSLSICEKYREVYPNNIIVMTTEHKGVSHARNVGLKLVKGEYINFLDSDDKLGVDVLSKVYQFFKKHEKYIDVVAIPMYFFDAQQGEHILNNKFVDSKIIDINKEYEAIQLSSSSAFVKAKKVIQYKFDERLLYAEDAKMLTQVLLETNKYGVVKDVRYWYRRREDCTSAIQNGPTNKDWYIGYIKYFSEELIEYSKGINKYPSEYVQYLIMYDLQWKIAQISKIKYVLNPEEVRTFKLALKRVLKNISYKIILKQKNMTMVKKIYTIILKI